MSNNTTDFAKLLNRYFTVYLTSQRGCSAVTIDAYRQVFVLFFHVHDRNKRENSG